MVLLFVILLSFPVLAQDFNTEVQNYLAGKLKDYDKIEFTIVNDSNLKNYKIDLSRELKIKNGTAYLPVKLIDRNKSTNSILTLQLKLYKQVPVAVREIGRKEAIDPDSYSLQSVDVTNLRNPATIFSPNSFRAKTNIKAGQIITQDLIEEIPLIQSGSRVTAEYIQGSVIISTEAIARQDGKANETIDILTSSNELLKAKVINSQKVLIE